MHSSEDPHDDEMSLVKSEEARLDERVDRRDDDDVGESSESEADVEPTDGRAQEITAALAAPPAISGASQTTSFTTTPAHASRPSLSSLMAASASARRSNSSNSVPESPLNQIPTTVSVSSSASGSTRNLGTLIDIPLNEHNADSRRGSFSSLGRPNLVAGTPPSTLPPVGAGTRSRSSTLRSIFARNNGSSSALSSPAVVDGEGVSPGRSLYGLPGAAASSASIRSVSSQSISAPLQHTLGESGSEALHNVCAEYHCLFTPVVSSNFVFPRSGPSASQISFISSRESLGIYGYPYGQQGSASPSYTPSSETDEPTALSLSPGNVANATASGARGHRAASVSSQLSQSSFVSASSSRGSPALSPLARNSSASPVEAQERQLSEFDRTRTMVRDAEDAGHPPILSYEEALAMSPPSSSSTSAASSPPPPLVPSSSATDDTAPDAATTVDTSRSSSAATTPIHTPRSRSPVRSERVTSTAQERDQTPKSISTAATDAPQLPPLMLPSLTGLAPPRFELELELATPTGTPAMGHTW